jgi:hypothetical protein
LTHRTYAVLFALALLLLPAAALAQGKNQKGSEPPGAIGSGAVTLKQLTEELQFLETEKESIVISFVLPKGWEIEEQGIDAKTKKLNEDLNVYSLISHAPVAKTGDPSDLIFELKIYKKGLLDNLPPDTPADQRNAGVQLWKFLNAQISINVRGGLKCTTPAQDIDKKPYGPGPPLREYTWFVPIQYDVPPLPGSHGPGSMLYTFTSMTGDKVWMLRFLVSKDQVDNYGALIALVLHNTFGMTKDEYEQYMAAAKAAGADKNNTKGNCKGKAK